MTGLPQTARPYALPGLFVLGVVVGCLLGSFVDLHEWRKSWAHAWMPITLVPLSNVEWQPINLTASYHSYHNSPWKATSLDASGSLPAEVQPLALSSMYPRTSSPKHEVVPIHWVIKSCQRPHIGRMLANTLLSGLFNGLYPASISIVWCKPYTNDTVIPSILYNIRHSMEFNMFFPPEELMKWQPAASTMTAMNVPDMLGAPHLPLLITEDDVSFLPDTNARIAAALERASEKLAGRPYMMTFYQGELRPFNTSQPTEPEWFQHVADDFHMEWRSEPLVTTMEEGTNWGTQVQLFSPVMVQMLRNYMYEAFTARRSLNHTNPLVAMTIGLEDMIIMNGIEQRYQCNRQGSNCQAFVVQPSIVQHTGTASTLFSAGEVNSRFHTASRFPMRIRFPTLEDNTYW